MKKVTGVAAVLLVAWWARRAARRYAEENQRGPGPERKQDVHPGPMPMRMFASMDQRRGG